MTATPDCGISTSVEQYPPIVVLEKNDGNCATSEPPDPADIKIVRQLIKFPHYVYDPA